MLPGDPLRIHSYNLLIYYNTELSKLFNAASKLESNELEAHVRALIMFAIEEGLDCGYKFGYSEAMEASSSDAEKSTKNSKPV